MLILLAIILHKLYLLLFLNYDYLQVMMFFFFVTIIGCYFLLQVMILILLEIIILHKYYSLLLLYMMVYRLCWYCIAQVIHGVFYN